MPVLPCIAVDSDGAVLDSMTVKHEQAFTPALIETFGLQSSSAAASQAFLELNLRSAHRGCNRFLALAEFCRALPTLAPAAALRHLPDLSGFLRWAGQAGALSATHLAAYALRHPGDAGLTLALKWSNAVNQRVARLPPAPAFAGAEAALRAAATTTLVAVVSSAPLATLRHEWAAAGLGDIPGEWGGQEAGSKAEQLGRRVAVRADPEQVLMIGDAPADCAAAVTAGTLFFPIVTGAEAESWHALRTEVLPRFPSPKLADSDLLRRWTERFWQALGLEAPSLATFP